MPESATLGSSPEATAATETDAGRRWPVPQAAMLVTTASILLWSLIAGVGLWLIG